MSNTLSYLIELRQRLIRYLILLSAVFSLFAFYANDVYHLLALPILSHLSHHSGLIAISIVAPFTVPLKAAFVMSVLLTMPFLLYQLWCFVVPGLYVSERRFAYYLLLAGVCLFYAGVVFAYSVVLPLTFHFLASVAPVGVEVRPGITEYFNFVIRLFFAFGFAFELPVVIVLLEMTGIYSAVRLSEKRPYVVIAAFVVGMVLTPPDVMSQILLAVPLWGLFELGLLMARLVARPAILR